MFRWLQNAKRNSLLYSVCESVSGLKTFFVAVVSMSFSDDENHSWSPYYVWSTLWCTCMFLFNPSINLRGFLLANIWLDLGFLHEIESIPNTVWVVKNLRIDIPGTKSITK